jgi:hypothetical protein
MKMTKSDVATLLNRKAVKPELINELITIIHQCETGVYTNAEMNVNKSELLENATVILTLIDRNIAS